MIYVALLRGINVGGNAKVDMKTLRDTFESLGFNDVSTYINSGNIIFETALDNERTICHEIEAAVEATFGFQVPVIVRSKENISHLCSHAPADWMNNKDQKTDVMFLWDEADKSDILDRIGYNPKIEIMKHTDRAVLWHIDRKYVTRSRVLRMIGTPLYKQITIRNINTLRKLNELMDKVESSQ